MTSTIEELDKETKIRKHVKERYASLADGRRGSCCGDREQNIELFKVPSEAEAVNAGCGSPLSLITPKEGEIVLDLGSGGGIDVFRASKLVGDKGKAIGVDSTPEMIWRARETAKRYSYSNVQFRLGEIERLPIESESVDYVISNCVINLSPDKQSVFDEAFRVLKRGGTFAVADITSEKEIPDEIKENMEVWSSCVSGAIAIGSYEEQLRKAGFKDVAIKTLGVQSSEGVCCSADGNNADQKYGIQSTHIIARKQ